MQSKDTPFYIKISSFISNLFNPMISLTLFFIFYSFSNGLSLEKNLIHFGFIFTIIILPIILWITWNVKMKKYTNADVSDRNQRKTLYFFIEFCQFLYLIIYYFYCDIIDFIVLFILILTLVMQWSNYYIKSSMHTAFNVFVAFLFYTIHPVLGVFWGMITLVVAFTRIVLQRHTIKEVLWGSIISVVISFMYLYAPIIMELKKQL